MRQPHRRRSRDPSQGPRAFSLVPASSRHRLYTSYLYDHYLTPVNTFTHAYALTNVVFSSRTWAREYEVYIYRYRWRSACCRHRDHGSAAPGGPWWCRCRASAQRSGRLACSRSRPAGPGGRLHQQLRDRRRHRADLRQQHHHASARMLADVAFSLGCRRGRGGAGSHAVASPNRSPLASGSARWRRRRSAGAGSPRSRTGSAAAPHHAHAAGAVGDVLRSHVWPCPVRVFGHRSAATAVMSGARSPRLSGFASGAFSGVHACGAARPRCTGG